MTSDGPAVILIPTFDDWPALHRLLIDLDAALDGQVVEPRVLIVDDGSTAAPPADLAPGPFRALERVDVLRLRRNLGHQRAIAVGLAYVEANILCRAVVVMDGDGEDAPRDVPRLLDALEGANDARVIFAERTRRSESLTFRAGYAGFRILHRVLVGRPVRFGNFSVIPRVRLASLVTVSELWNHYAASVVRSRQPFATIPTDRAHRLDGRSSMNFVALVIHGLGAISVFSEVVGVRLLVAAFGMIGLAVAGLLAATLIRLATDLAIPGWATTVTGFLLILLVQAVMFAFVFSFLIIGGRQGSTFLPCRDYPLYVAGLEPLYPRTAPDRTEHP